MKRYILMLIFSVLCIYLKAQYITTGDDPASIRWRQINTKNFQVIYPSEFESKAQRMASVLEKVYDYAGQTLKHQPHKISVILHTSPIISNGMVAWAPKRIEMFTTPPQDTYAQDWLDQLATHEFRHVVQIDKIESELPNIFKALLGEQAAALVVGAYLPFWFLEGDAVSAETALSHTGRGRLPSFEMELKAQVLDKRIYSFDKSYLGSYRDNVPDYYQSGYQLVAGVRSKYGAETWSNVLHYIARNPLSINAFSKGLRMNTGKNQSGLYSETFNDLKMKWLQEDKALKKSEFEKITKEYRFFTSYRFPYFVNDSTFFAVRNSIDDLTRFVLIGSNGNEKKLFTPGSISDESVSFEDNRVFWIEQKPDPRWTNRELSLLRIYNIKDGRIFQKVYREKLFTPVLSADGQYLACIRIDLKNTCSILLLSPVTGEIIKDVPAPENLYFITPSWAEKENELYAVVLGSQGKSLVKFNPFTSKISYLLPFTYNNLVRPIQKGRYLYFNNSQGGIDNVYALDLIENRTFRITSSRFGTTDPQISKDGNKIVYGDYTANGFCIAAAPITKENFAPVDAAQSADYKLADKIASQEKGIVDLKQTDSLHYRSENYSKFANLINFHSWAPFHIDTDNQELRPGVSLLSQNKLSTAVTQLGYDYSTINNTGKWFAKFDYTGLYPVLGFETDYGKVKKQYYEVNNQGQIVKTVDFSYNELNINGNLRIPFNLTHGRMYRLIQPEFRIGYTNRESTSSLPQDISKQLQRTFTPLTYRLYANNYLALGNRDIQPRFGQVINLTYRNTPLGNLKDSTDIGNIWSAEGTLYFPGALKHHGFRFYGGYQESSSILFSDLIEYPRGYQIPPNTKLLTIRSDYVMPLFYPDLSLGKLSYFKRVSLRLFYDYTKAMVVDLQNSTKSPQEFSSVGGELTIDCHFLRFIVPATIGVRQSYLIENKGSATEVLFTINFNQYRTSK